MKRAHVRLTEDQVRYLTTRSRATGESRSSLVRRAIDQLRRTEPAERAEDLIGAFEADRDDVSRRHDEIFGQTAR